MFIAVCCSVQLCSSANHSNSLSLSRSYTHTHTLSPTHPLSLSLRRLAAVGVAMRVSEEMASPIGTTVGYMVKGDSKANERTKIVFCTYGVLLRRLQVSVKQI